MENIGLQLYTVRELFGSDEQAVETLTKIKEMGYTAVQFFGGKDRIITMGKAAKKVGLTCMGNLSDLDTYIAMGDELFELCREYDIPDLGISSFHSDEEEVKEFVGRVNEFAAKARAEGFSFSYHNHANEFVRFASGKRIMDYFLEGFTADVDFMPDTYWIQAGGADVRHFLEITEGRVKILHLKDMKVTLEKSTFAEIGQGSLWFEGIIETAKKLGINQFAVEQDICDGDPMESANISINYLKKV